MSKLIHHILTERLTGTTYHPDTCAQWCREISDEVKHKLKELDLPRYKYVVTVTIGESRGAGVRWAPSFFSSGRPGLSFKQS